MKGRALARQSPTSPSIVVRRRSGVTTMEGLVRLWLQGASPHTVLAYRSDIAWWEHELGGALDLQELTVADVVRVLERERSDKPATMARRWATLRSLSRYAHREVGFTDFDVCAPIRTPRRGPDPLAERILDPEQVAELVAACAGTRHPERDRLIIRLLYYSGARCAELVTREWRHVRKRGDRVLLTLHGKGDRTRTVALPASVSGDVLALRESLGRRARGPLFRSERGGAMSTRAVRHLLARLRKRARMELAVSPHWLRHTHATVSIERGAPIHVVTATLGHASVATTTRYLHARPSQSSGDWL